MDAYRRYTRGSKSRVQGNNNNFSRSRAAAKYYSYGAQAAKIEDERDNVSLKYYGKLEKIENRIAVREKLLKLVCFLVICGVGITLIFAKSMVYNYRLENSRLLSKLEEEREKIVSMTAQSIERIDIAYVEEVAVSRLNMAKPQSYQIVYIEVPKSDYIVPHEAYTVVEKEKLVSTSYKNAASVAAGVREAVALFLSKVKDDGAEE